MLLQHECHPVDMLKLTSTTTNTSVCTSYSTSSHNRANMEQEDYIMDDSTKIKQLIAFDHWHKLIKFFHQSSPTTLTEVETRQFMKYGFSKETNFQSMKEESEEGRKARFVLLWFCMFRMHEWDIQSEEHEKLCVLVEKKRSMHVHSPTHVLDKLEQLNNTERRMFLFIDSILLDSKEKYEKVMKLYGVNKDFHMIVTVQDNHSHQSIIREVNINSNCITFLENCLLLDSSLIDFIQSHFVNDTIHVIIATATTAGTTEINSSRRNHAFHVSSLDEALQRLQYVSSQLQSYYSSVSNTTLAEHFKNKVGASSNENNSAKLGMDPLSFNKFLKTAEVDCASRFELLKIYARDKLVDEQVREDVKFIPTMIEESEVLLNEKKSALITLTIENQLTLGGFQIDSSNSQGILLKRDSGDESLITFEKQGTGKASISLTDFSLTTPNDYNNSTQHSSGPILYTEWLSNTSFFRRVDQFTNINTNSTNRTESSLKIISEKCAVVIPLIWKRGTAEQRAYDLVLKYHPFNDQFVISMEKLPANSSSTTILLNPYCTNYFANQQLVLSTRNAAINTTKILNSTWNSPEQP